MYLDIITLDRSFDGFVMKDNPILFSIDLTEIYTCYRKEIAGMLDIGINIRDILTDLILDNNRYGNIFKNNTGDALRDSLIRHIVNTSGPTKMPYRDAIEHLKQYKIDSLMLSLCSFLIYTLYLPIKDICLHKQEKRYIFGKLMMLENYTVIIPVYFGNGVLPIDNSIVI